MTVEDLEALPDGAIVLGGVSCIRNTLDGLRPGFVSMGTLLSGCLTPTWYGNRWRS